MAVAAARLYYVDNLRTALTALVVFHHAGQPYGPGGWWPMEASARTNWIGPFFSVNAAFFMGLFFFLSGYFHPPALRRKGPAQFAWDRVIRLGVPLAAFFFVIVPVVLWSYHVRYRVGAWVDPWSYYRDIYWGAAPRPAGWSGPTWPDMQFLHTWFIEHLLIYGLGYALLATVMNRLLPGDQAGFWRRPSAGSPSSQAPAAAETPSPDARSAPLAVGRCHAVMAGYAALLALATGLIRVPYPMNDWRGLLGIIQIEWAHWPQYFSLFVAGILASRGDWLRRLPDRVGATWLAIGLGAAVFRYAEGWNIIDWIPPLDARQPFRIGASWAVWEALLCTGLCVGSLWAFRRWGNWSGRFWSAASESAYGVYLVHLPLVVVWQSLLEPTGIGLGWRFWWSGLAGVVSSFVLVHYGLLRLPGGRRVLG